MYIWAPQESKIINLKTFSNILWSRPATEVRLEPSHDVIKIALFSC